MKTIKAVELVVEGTNDIIVAASTRDSKPVYFLSSSFIDTRCV